MAGLAAPAMAQNGMFDQGNLVVVQLGDGSTALSGSATQATLREFQPGANMFTGDNLVLPSGATGRRLTNSGTATSEGFLTLSTDANYLTYQGYDAQAGTATIASTTSAATNRVVARVGFDMSLDTSTALTDAFNTSNIRSSILDGTTVYTSGTSAGTPASGGARSSVFGGTTSTGLSTNQNNMRVLNMSGGVLMGTSGSGANVGINVISGGSATVWLSTAGTGVGTASPYDFIIAGNNIVYIADDRATANGGGLQKWVDIGGVWNLSYTLNSGLGAGLRNLAYDASSGTIYATSAETTANKIVSIQDTGASSAFSTLATAGTNTIFRGIEFAPIPSPGSIALLTFGGLAAARRRR
jgi:hypothetical protein